MKSQNEMVLAHYFEMSLAPYEARQMTSLSPREAILSPLSTSFGSGGF